VRAGGRGGREVPHQVAFNRRYVPLLAELRARVERLPPGAALQHVRYEMVRVNRRDADFSTTAVHAIDAVRFIAGADFVETRFRYQPVPDAGDGVANIFMDAVLRSGVTAHLSFCPMAGVVVERAALHARDHTLLLEIPMWNAYDSPGRLVHLVRGTVVEDLRGGGGADSNPVVLSGFYGEYEAFFGSLAAAQPPTPSLGDTRQSVEVAEAMRARKTEWRSSPPSGPTPK
jgi:predicted dehydrogenase